METPDRISEPYFTLVAGLPLPAPFQTEQFVAHVADAHSWYKGALFPPGMPFLFYLDPNAGRDVEPARSGQWVAVDRTDERRGLHYSWTTTSGYHARFGCWQYAVGKRRLDPASNCWHYLPPLGRVLDQAGRWVALPGPAVRAGLCYVTGFVHDWFCERTEPSPENRAWWERNLAKGLFRPYNLCEKFLSRRSLEAFARFAAEHPDHPDVPRYATFAATAADYCEVRDGGGGPDGLKAAYLAMEPFFAAERSRLRERFRDTLLKVLQLFLQTRGVPAG